MLPFSDALSQNTGIIIIKKVKKLPFSAFKTFGYSIPSTSTHSSYNLSVLKAKPNGLEFIATARQAPRPIAID